MQLIQQKTCTTCGVTKPQTTDFYNLLSSGHWRGSCKECRKAVSRKHHAENPSMTAVRRSNYNERKKNAIGSYTKSDLDNLRVKQNNCCAYCGDQLNSGGELDHRTSLLRGGSNEISNLAWACRTCNRDKGSKSASEFFAWRKKLGMKINERVIFLKRKPRLV